MDELAATVARLRAPDGCPWDREQTHRSLTINLLEEAAEAIDAIEKDDMANLREELGDVLLQVVLHAQIAAEAGEFTLGQVAAGINEKLIRRHPHVFGENRLGTSAEVLVQWDAIKAEEKRAAGVDAKAWPRPPDKLPALLFARDVAKRLAKAGVAPVVQSPGSTDPTTEDEAGARLFALVVACRRAGIDPEAALRRHADSIHAAAAPDARGT